MTSPNSGFDASAVLHELKHYLPAQAPLKDFVHHNTLHAFQTLKFYDGIRAASELLGYNVSLSLSEYRSLYAAGNIRADVLKRVLTDRKGPAAVPDWQDRLIKKSYAPARSPRIGTLRANWKRQYQFDLDSRVHPLFFRLLCSYLDQGISIWTFPVKDTGFLAAMRELERHSFSSVFRTARARKLLLDESTDVTSLLQLVVGDESLFGQYLFDQQFAHQGWSGMVSVIEDLPETLLDRKNITLAEVIIFELLLEIDALDAHFGTRWQPLARVLTDKPLPLFAPVEPTELDEVLSLWQDAYEWTYYDQVLTGLKQEKAPAPSTSSRTFQAMFCIDDRECSFRRYLEEFDPACETFGTPGFFGAEFFFQPEDGLFYTKVCPAPVTPKFLIKETGTTGKRAIDLGFTKAATSFYSGWLVSQTLGFWAVGRLALNIFRPAMSPATASSHKHMDRASQLIIEHKEDTADENGLQIGFRVDEMANRVEALLKSIGLVEDFASLVYVIGHGASSANNPHYAAYDCGACSGRAGSVNARVISYMANQPQVRGILSTRGIEIPDTTQFMGGLHDTTRDEIVFFDEDLLSPVNVDWHRTHEPVFAKALDSNAKERSRRFMSIDTTRTPRTIHEQVKSRSVSLFEPRPELNHATNALCIVGRRSLTKGLFLDRRAFLNSFDAQVDPTGKYLLGILRAAAPVCGGINLEYFFSRVDNQKLGAGTKLPHNVMGLFGVANGIDGDLRPGLPSQMIEVHDPIRLLLVVEHDPQVVLDTIQQSAPTYEWFINEWVHLVVIDPTTRALFRFKDGQFTPYQPVTEQLDVVSDMTPLVEANHDNMPVYLLN